MWWGCLLHILQFLDTPVAIHRRQLTDGRTDGRVATLNAAPRKDRIIKLIQNISFTFISHMNRSYKSNECAFEYKIHRIGGCNETDSLLQISGLISKISVEIFASLKVAWVSVTGVDRQPPVPYLPIFDSTVHKYLLDSTTVC